MHAKNGSAIGLAITAVFLSIAGGGAFAAVPLRATMELKDGDSTVGFLVKATDQAVVWQYTPEGAATSTTPVANITEIEYDDPEGWAQAVALYRKGDHAAASDALGKIADDYKDLMSLKGNPSANARFFQIESLRKQGEFTKLGEILDDDLVSGLKNALQERLHLQLDLNAGWSAVGSENWEVVDALVAANSEDGQLKDRAPRYLTQLTFMRGLSREAKEEKDGARKDFYHTCTLGFGNDISMSGLAHMRIMNQLVADPEQLAKDKRMLKQLHGLTRIYMKVYGRGVVPAGFEEYAKPLEEEEEEAAPVPDAPVEPAPAATPEEAAPAADAPAAPDAAGADAQEGKADSGEDAGASKGKEKKGKAKPKAKPKAKEKGNAAAK